MGLWYLITWRILEKNRDAHDVALRKWVRRTTQIFPHQRYRYFDARFTGPNKRVLAFTDLDNLADYEEFLSCLRNDEQWCTYFDQWKASIDASSMQPLYWEERNGQLEE